MSTPTPNPTTQLVEAIDQEIEKVWLHSLDFATSWYFQALEDDERDEAYITYKQNTGNQAQTALLLAIADAVDTWIGEDVVHTDECPWLLDWSHRPSGPEWLVCDCDAGAYNAERARMRTFTAALRKATK